jgi:integrase
MGLTKRQIDAAAYAGTGNSRCVLWDDNPPGLGLRIYPGGRKAFVLSYRSAGRKRMMTLGDFGTFTLEAARRRARAELVGVESHHVDPLADKRRRALEAKTGTVEAMFRAYIEARRTDPRNPMKSADRQLELAELHIFPEFGTRPWRDVRRSEVRAWHDGFKKTPYQGNRALMFLRAAYYWRLWQEDDSAEARQHRDTRNPCAGIKLFPERARQVRLELTEVPKLEAAIDAETGDPYIRALFRFVLATGCRKSEALTLRWADVNLTAGEATFREVKAGGNHTIALSDYAKALLRKLPAIEGNPYVFAGYKPGSHLHSAGKAWGRIRKRAGLQHVRIHDLRRSFGFWLGEAGFTSKQIGASLGHRSNVTSSVYMALGPRTKREAVDKIAALMKAVSRKPKKRGAR